MKAWTMSNAGLALVDRPEPTAGPREVIVAIRAVSLNYREGYLGRAATGDPYIPGSDGAGEVIAVGPDVTRFRVGDRVVTTFYTAWASGPMPSDIMGHARGQPGHDGVLAERIVSSEDWVLPIPDHLSWEEAATLSCAGLTAWNAVQTANVRQGQSVLILGTGGVSIFALQFVRAAGARIIVTSSSDAKLARAKALGADVGINYRQQPEWQHPVRAATGGKGVDHVIEVGGDETIARSIEALAHEGHIALAGARSGFDGKGAPLLPLILKAARTSGVLVGSREMFENMLASISANQLHPVVDRTFPFEDAPAAFSAFDTSAHFGKIVISTKT
jgi:NADPH:quinone reductase-like Zn-dependent oxidoreductase